MQKMPSSGVLLYVVEMDFYGVIAFFGKFKIHGCVSTFVVKHRPRAKLLVPASGIPRRTRMKIVLVHSVLTFVL